MKFIVEISDKTLDNESVNPDAAINAIDWGLQDFGLILSTIEQLEETKDLCKPSQEQST